MVIDCREPFDARCRGPRAYDTMQDMTFGPPSTPVMANKRPLGDRLAPIASTVVSAVTVGGILTLWALTNLIVARMMSRGALGPADALYAWAWFLSGLPFIVLYLIALVIWGRTRRKGVLAAVVALVLLGAGRIAAGITDVKFWKSENVVMSNPWIYYTISSVAFIGFVLGFVVSFAIARRRTPQTWLGLIIVLPLVLGVAAVEYKHPYSAPFNGLYPDLAAGVIVKVSGGSAQIFVSWIEAAVLIGVCSVILWAFDAIGLRKQPSTTGSDGTRTCQPPDRAPSWNSVGSEHFGPVDREGRYGSDRRHVEPPSAPSDHSMPPWEHPSAQPSWGGDVGEPGTRS